MTPEELEAMNARIESLERRVEQLVKLLQSLSGKALSLLDEVL